MAVSLQCFAMSGESVEGLVVDAETRPIAGATVIVSWYGSKIRLLRDSQTWCYHVDVAVTDSGGKYSIPSWTSESPYGWVWTTREYTRFEALKPGYVLSLSSRREGTSRRISLKKFEGPREAYFGYLRQMAAGFCGGDGSEKNLVNVYLQISEEAKAVAANPQEIGAATDIERKAQILEAERARNEGRPATKPSAPAATPATPPAIVKSPNLMSGGSSTGPGRVEEPRTPERGPTK